MKILFKELSAGDFFVFRYNDEVNIYQKISSINGYNAVLLNTGHLCNIYEENTKLEKVMVEFTIKEHE
jgi:hypothetical protein